MPEDFKKNIIWIASYPKSGNTWFRVLLSNILSDSDEVIEINNLIDTPISSSRSLVDKYLGLNTSDLSKTEINNLRPLVYEMISSENTNDVFFKTHDAWDLTEKGKSLFPKEVTKGVIYLIRNPLDVAVSLSFHSSLDIDSTIENMNSDNFGLCVNSDKLVSQLPQALFSWSTHVISWVFTSGLPVHIIRYEDLLENTASSLSNALKFLKIDYTVSTINKAIKNSSFKSLQLQEKVSGFKEKSIYSDVFFRYGNKDNWMTHLKKSQAKQIVNVHDKLMSKFGYKKEKI